MLYGPDMMSDDEEGFSDDPDYEEFKQRVQAIRKEEFENSRNRPLTEAEKRQNLFTTLFNAVSSKRVELVVDELDKGLDVNSVLQDGWTILLLAASFGSEPIVTEVLNWGADVKYAKDGTTALMYACAASSSYSPSHAVNSDSSAVTNEEQTENSEIFRVVKLLVEKGSEVKALDRKRRTPLMLAAYAGHLEAVKFLLPLGDKDAVDNQRWTALFWAVDGNNPKTVQYLLDQGLDPSLKDLRGNSILEHAQNQGLYKVIEILPQETYIDYISYFDNNNLAFEDHFENLKEGQLPQFFNDMCKILYGARSESTIPIWAKTKINLLEFLSLTDKELKEIGIKLPYQRSRILGGLYRFHKRTFGPNSLKAVPKNAIITNVDVASTLLTCIKQLVAMDASIKFIMKNCGDDIPEVENCRDLREVTSRLDGNLRKLKVASHCVLQRTKTWDSSLKSVDLITRKRRNIPWANLVASAGLLPLFIAIGIKIYHRTK